jgi:hypothetical protein
MWLPAKVWIRELDTAPGRILIPRLGYGSGAKFGFGLSMLLQSRSPKDRAGAASPDPSSGLSEMGRREPAARPEP